MKNKFNKIYRTALWIILFSLSACKGDELNISDSATIKKWISDGALIVDVRTPEEFNAGNYKNSINLPVGDMEKNMEIFGDKDRRIIVYCRSGRRSSNAKKILKAHGYTKVINGGAFTEMPELSFDR